MASTMLTYHGQVPITLAYPGRSLTVNPGDKVDGKEWPGLADRPDFGPAPTRAKTTKTTKGKGG